MDTDVKAVKVFNAERAPYYRAKKRELAHKEEARRVIKEDALFVHHYTMPAFITLFPEVKEFGMSYHRELVKELEKIRARHLGQELGGTYLAVAATKDKKARSKFRKIVKDLVGK